MKKSICLTFILFITILGFSQQKFQMSFLASPSINWLSSDQKEVNTDGITGGFDFGVNTDIFFDDEGKYAFATGLMITNTGGKLDYLSNQDFEFAGETLPNRSTIRYRLQYVEIPMALKLKTSAFHRWTYWGQFGLSGFVNVRARGDSNDGVLDKTTINEEVNLFNVALNMGVGSEFDLGGNNAITMGVVYKNGLVDVTTNNAFSDRTTLNSLVLRLGLVF